MSAVANLALERLRKATDNATVTPRELVTLIADYMDRGEVDGEPIRMVALVECKLPDGNYSTETFRVGCSRYEEIALLALWHARQLEDWRTS